jgi:uncharacterized protein YbaR (Trm112 family)
VKTCSIPGCDRKLLARTWCATHYQRWRTTGEPGEAELRRTPGNPNSTEKPCTTCKTVYPVAEYYAEKRNRDGRSSQCKSCIAIQQAPYRRQAKYGLSPEQYEAAVEKHDGRCPICSEPAKLVIDHDHKTGAFRDIICDRCNRLLGVADDSVNLLHAAISYLHTHSV